MKLAVYRTAERPRHRRAARATTNAAGGARDLRRSAVPAPEPVHRRFIAGSWLVHGWFMAGSWPGHAGTARRRRARQAAPKPPGRRSPPG
ncbi:hypothetical protein BMA721280_L0223 [Burkholderia mallei 2002721280]|nr:hypothetical protein BMA10247_A1137 [Burkholderia mallei NCTC 10247]EDK84026.1 hypothetical protein BMA721280_L0223 [Burkholderia mallei 2002721280]